MNTATQELTINGKGQEKIRRWAICPVHETKSSTYIGPTADGWLFACIGPGHMSHNFCAKPDKSAPKTIADTQAWLEAKRKERIGVVEGRKRGA